ncbi:MAG: hypothetical protein JWL59_997 [Chthoniobacteraceae bacterium]|nr:hypothetical protein [Chthoniobacteraceae bacterium]
MGKNTYSNTPMKKHIALALVALVAAVLLPACTTVEAPSPTVHSTTTETSETSVHRPVGSSVESTTVRSY